tara:strand:- start:468 stop:725 length:258 start_codon:yes stop_codon:yes gene_type:complete
LGATQPVAPCRYARLTIVRRANGTKTYGTLRDEGVITEVERVCEWLMDPVLCPTTWPVLLKIRGENPTCAPPRRLELSGYATYSV